MRYLALILIASLLYACPQPIVAIEKNGYVFVEAEDYQFRTNGEIRKWRTIKETTRQRGDDPDPSHAATASGGAYLEALPDTRVTHDDELIVGTNFSNEAGEVAVISYPIRFNTPGRYYVWVRAFSTGTEDNGIHVGVNYEWPESGQRMQWCEGKNQWTWASKQRTQEAHCGVEQLIFIDVPYAGTHTVCFSMREDGFEFDAFALSQVYQSPTERP